MNKHFYTTSEVAGLLRVKRQTVYKWICEGKIPSIAIGGITLFDEQEIDDWIAMHRREVIVI